MIFEKPVDVQWVASFTNSKILGGDTREVLGINEIHKVREGDITYVDVEKYYKKSFQSDATFILINKEVPVPEGKVLLYNEDPFGAYNSLVKALRHERAFLGTMESRGDSWIHPSAVIGHNCKIGKGCCIYPNVVIYDDTVVGDHVTIHSGAVIGADAFYYKKDTARDNHYTKMVSCGRVVIEDHVEIGACTTIDKGVSGDTIIGLGSKLDNHIHVGHGVVIGKNVLIAAQVGIGGKTIIEDDVVVWGQVGINKDVRIGQGAEILAQSGVMGDLQAGRKYFGSPAQPSKEMMKQLIYLKRNVNKK